MSLLTQLTEDMKQAMLTKQALVLSVLRMLLSELNYKKIDAQHELSDEEIVAVIRKEVKKRDEAIESFTKADRQEQVIQETQEKQVLQAYLPQLMSEEEIRSKIQDTRSIDGVTDFGQIMRIVSPMFKGKADGGLMAKVVKELLVS